jgi:uncharacterized phiE125 gp8 family phage protein
MAVLQLIQAPAVEPVTVDEAKTHCNIFASADDGYVTGLIAAARRKAENYTRSAFITQKWRYLRDGFPGYSMLYERSGYNFFYVPKPPLQTIDLFTFVDTAGVVQTLATPVTDYQLDKGGEQRPARLIPPFARPWLPTRMVPNSVIVEFTCGYGDDGTKVPDDIRLAIKMMVADWYATREDSSVMSLHSVPRGVCELLDDYRNLLS